MTLTMPKLLDDGCVLQSGRPVNIWGWCTPGERVSVRIGECTGETISAADGGWQVRLDALDPGGPYAFEVIGDGTTVRRSCYAGEAFLCSGQSNMELSMQWVHSYYPSEFQRQDDPLLRQFKVVDRYDFSGPVRDHEEASWLGCAPETLGQFSAVAYFFGRMVRQWLQVPVGLLNVSLGGSPSKHGWTPLHSMIVLKRWRSWIPIWVMAWPRRGAKRVCPRSLDGWRSCKRGGFLPTSCIGAMSTCRHVLRIAGCRDSRECSNCGGQWCCRPIARVLKARCG